MLAVRRLLAALLALAVPVGAVCAPLMHAHRDDRHDSHHGVNTVHAHFSGHQGAHHQAQSHHHDAPGLPEIEAESNPELVTRVQFFVADQPNVLIPVALQPLGITLTAPLASMMRRPPLVSHGHDPPRASRSSPRAPPPLLS